jgi:hypothetical protein
VSEIDRNNSCIKPSQYARVKNAVKGEKEVRDGTEHDYCLIDKFLEEAVNTFNIYESQQENLKCIQVSV